MTTYTPEQQAENRAKWVAALRSGDYKQTTGTLAREKGGVRSHCCLGVACELAVLEGVIGPATPACGDVTGPGVLSFPNVDAPDVRELAATGTLPLEVQRWLGLGNDNGHISADRCLSSLNDNGCTFAEIANIIESGEVELAESE